MTNPIISDHRLLNQRISGYKHRRPEEVVQELGAIQAQDYMQAVWAIGLRSQDATLSSIKKAIADRKIVLTWALRGTIHCVPSEDVRWMQQLSASRVLGQSKGRMAQLGLDEEILERCRTIIYNALKGQRIVTRPELLAVLEDAGITTNNQRGYHILWNSTYHGLICFGPMSEKQQTFVLLDERIPFSRELSFDESLAELAMRYFRSHGPATLQDFAWWTGMTLTDSRRALEAVKGELQSVQIAGLEYWSTEAEVPQYTDNSEVHLLPGFDEYILGYKDRSAVLEPEIAPLIVPGNNGMFLATLVVGGRVIGTWKRNLKKKGIEIDFTLFESLNGREEEVLQAAERYGVFMGLPILKVDIN